MKEILAKKGFSQNFLINEYLIERMVKEAGFLKDDVVLEIGPGRGGMTKNIEPLVKKIIAIEADKYLVDQLKKEFEQTSVNVIQGSILNYIPCEKLKVFGNIPYHISTDIVEWILKHRLNIQEVFLTVQLEFAQRLLAKQGTKQRCALSCCIELLTETDILFKVPASAFRPRPKVMSAFLRMKIRSDMMYNIQSMEILMKVLHVAFLQRRKTISNALKTLLSPQEIPESFSFKRAQDLSLEEFVMLANNIYLKG